MLCVLHSLSHLWESDFAVEKDLRYVSVALIDSHSVLIHISK